MKKYILFSLLFVLNREVAVFSAIPSRIAKSVSVVPPYSAMSGRRFYITEEQDLEPVVIDVAGLNRSAYYFNPNNSRTLEDIAIERNRRMRASQLERSSKKPEGSYGYYLTTVLPEGANPAIEPS